MHLGMVALADGSVLSSETEAVISTDPVPVCSGCWGTAVNERRAKKTDKSSYIQDICTYVYIYTHTHTHIRSI